MSSGLFPALCLALGGCLLGCAIVAGGFVLADEQKSALEKQFATANVERQQLISALSEARLTVPRLRLEELAALPLVPEYLAFANKQPDGEVTEELKAYLQTVLDAVSEETGLARIALETADGTELLVTQNGLPSSSVAKEPRLEAKILDFEDLDRTSGKLTGYLPENTTNVLLPPGDGGTEITTSTSAAMTIEPPAISSIPDRTRLLAILAGLATAVLGFIGAALLKRQHMAAS